MAYSTQVGSCTVQTTVTIEPGLEVEDAKMADMFAQMVIDTLHECAGDFQSEALFQRLQLVLACRIAGGGRVTASSPRHLWRTSRKWCYPPEQVQTTRLALN
ncbi:MAG: hypothetical protein QM756_23775 [Polyangiaceae bacterium]